MNRRWLVIFLIVVCCGCKPAQKAAAPQQAGGPQLKATVVTIRTTIEPGAKTFQRDIVISGDRARDTGEHDAWRLFDLKANRVTFVDDAAKTIRTEPLDALLQKRRATLAEVLPPHYARVSVKRTGAKKQIQGVNAEQTLIEVGAYKRELWLGEHRAIPKELFAMLEASDAPSSPLAPMMRSVDEALTNARAFPLHDRAELPYGKQKLVVDRAVVSIAQRDVPQSVLEVPRDYEDVTPKPAPAPAPAKK